METDTQQLPEYTKIMESIQTLIIEIGKSSINDLERTHKISQIFLFGLELIIRINQDKIKSNELIIINLEKYFEETSRILISEDKFSKQDRINFCSIVEISTDYLNPNPTTCSSVKNAIKQNLGNLIMYFIPIYCKLVLSNLSEEEEEDEIKHEAQTVKTQFSKPVIDAMQIVTKICSSIACLRSAIACLRGEKSAIACLRSENSEEQIKQQIRMIKLHRNLLSDQRAQESYNQRLKAIYAIRKKAQVFNAQKETEIITILQSTADDLQTEIENHYSETDRSEKTLHLKCRNIIKNAQSKLQTIKTPHAKEASNFLKRCWIKFKMAYRKRKAKKILKTCASTFFKSSETSGTSKKWQKIFTTLITFFNPSRKCQKTVIELSQIMPTARRFSMSRRGVDRRSVC